MLVRSGFLRAAGGWSPAAVPAEDVALWLHAADTPAAFVPATVLEYRIHAGPRPVVDVERIESELRAAFVARCDGTRRDAAAQLVEARSFIRHASAAFADDDGREAVGSLVHAFRLAPSLVASPILGPSLLASLGKATAAVALGRRGSAATRRLARRLRGVQGRTGLPS
jgi:hypothetical protein